MEFVQQYDVFDMAGASVRAPWEYVTLIGDGDVIEIQVLFVKNKTMSPLIPILRGQDPVSVNELHCTKTHCLALDIDHHMVISVDPLIAAVTNLYALCISYF